MSRQILPRSWFAGAAMGLRQTGLMLLIITIIRYHTVHSNAEPVDVDDEESDSVPYMIVVEHAEGRRCAGALVSLRTALSSVRCARPRTLHSPLWALAAALVTRRGAVRASDGARRVVRLAFAATAADLGDSVEEMALLALDEPFGESAQSRPILMATSMGECDAAPECNTVRALSRRVALGGPFLHLLVLSAKRAPSTVCAAHVHHWAASKERSLCFKGETLCESDLGGGVVCAGLLCGVLSALGQGAANGSERVRCGEAFAALALARRRRFLHCAHTERRCGIGDCKSLCTEQLLEVESESASASSTLQMHTSPAIASSSPALHSTYNPRRGTPIGNSSSQSRLRDGFSTHGASVPSRTPLLLEVRHAANFEPNRADFRRARPSPSTLAMSSMRLKAGEYGDNAADYGALPDEALPVASRTPPHRTDLASRFVTSRPATTSGNRSDRHDPLAQAQTEAKENAAKTSDAPNRPIHMMLLIPIIPFVLINR